MIRLLIFLAVVGTIYVLAGVISVRWLVRKVRRRPAPPRTPTGRWTRRGVLGLAGAGVGGLAWGRFVEPYWLETTHLTIASPKLAGLTRPLRLAHFSDLHCDPVVRAEDILIARLRHWRPDLIVFTGDCVNSAGGLPVFRSCMSRVARIAPTFAVRGNWDGWFGIRDHFDGTGVRELDGAWQTVSLAGATLHVGGLWCGRPHELAATLAARPREGLGLFLYHYPDELDPVAAAGVDLYCAGHTHGGQIALPWFGAIITLSRHGKRYEHGFYRCGATHMYVNRGIGMEGKGAPRIRICARPELTCIELVGEK